MSLPDACCLLHIIEFYAESWFFLFDMEEMLTLDLSSKKFLT